MTYTGWRDAVIEAASRHAAGDSKLLDLLTKLLVEQGAAKQALLEAGFGCTGMPWANVVAEVARWRQERE